MSNITLQTIESLPLIEEVNENTSLVGWDGEKTVRMPAPTGGIQRIYAGTSEGTGIDNVLYYDAELSVGITREEMLALIEAGKWFLIHNSTDTNDTWFMPYCYFVAESYDTISFLCLTEQNTTKYYHTVEWAENSSGDNTDYIPEEGD